MYCYSKKVISMGKYKMLFKNLFSKLNEFLRQYTFFTFLGRSLKIACITTVLPCSPVFSWTLAEAQQKAEIVFLEKIADVVRSNGIDPARCKLKANQNESAGEFIFVVDCRKMAGAIVLDRNLEVVLAEVY